MGDVAAHMSPNLQFDPSRRSSPRVKSLMPESRVIFSDRIEADFLDFNSGALATIGIAPHQGKLIQ